LLLCFSSQLFAEQDPIAQRMEKAIADGEISGAVTLVIHQGKKTHLAATGMADVAAKRRMQTDSLFYIASMTKPITSTALMILVEQGKVALDDPVMKYIPEFAAVQGPQGKLQEPVTIQHMITHTSGLGGSQKTAATLAATAKELAGRKLSFTPGERWQYSPGLNVCGRIIEVVSGMSFDQFLAENMFEPLKMNDTAFKPKERKRLAQLYKPGESKGQIAAADHWLTDAESKLAPNPSGGLVSCADDLGKFYQMILNGGELGGKRILSEASVKRMTSLQTGQIKTGFTPGNGWGLGWCVVRQPQGVSAALSPGSFGHGGAFGTQGWVDPTNQTIFVLLIQRTGFGNADGSSLRGDFQDLAVEQLETPAASPATN